MELPKVLNRPTLTYASCYFPLVLSFILAHLSRRDGQSCFRLDLNVCHLSRARVRGSFEIYSRAVFRTLLFGDLVGTLASLMKE